ncbi:MAG: hypothetical protein KGJ23_07220 [Euryarchaeota archaeon]|nr:hypothetical protein [Euryarchaeota archaeon]MDE1836390.1 hypothetical protein [Euryarchaeota archaeon]MDE1879599.1 hypothetical protein [Euryarchaeota archaeon]MDE2044138.1 hypothetical protein [Thermoplasmata archaeon]
MSDVPSEGTTEAPPGKKPTPWSVRKIVEQVTGRPLESMQDPPGTRRAPRPAPPPRSEPPLERFHEEDGPALSVLVDPDLEREERPRSVHVEAAGVDELEKGPGLRAFLPGAPNPPVSGRAPRPASLPLTRPLPRQVIEEVERMREDEGEAPLGSPSAHAHGSRELERVYLSYLLMHMDRLTEPALKYLRHAVEEECEERGIRP